MSKNDRHSDASSGDDLFQFVQVDPACKDNEPKKSKEKVSRKKHTNDKDKYGGLNGSKKHIEEKLRKLFSLKGLQEVKAEVKRIVSRQQMAIARSEKGLPAVQVSSHMLFLGNPGTGKTTVARILADIFKSLGVISKGHLVEVDRSALVAGYTGQTAIKTAGVLQSSLGGVLFIDEAYSLSPAGRADKDSFGSEAIETILKFMEDNRHDLIVIAAGYSQNMEAFIDSNPGLKSRFTTSLTFADFSNAELIEIYLELVSMHGYEFMSDPEDKISTCIDRMRENEGDNFGNARSMRTLFEKTLDKHAERALADGVIEDHELTLLMPEDIPDIVQ